MKRYLVKRYEIYVIISIGLLIGFTIGSFLFDKPDYKSAIIAILFGLMVGELFIFLKWSKDQRKNT